MSPISSSDGRTGPTPDTRVACVDFRKAASRDTVTLCCETNCSFNPSLPEESMKIFSLFSLIVLISLAHAGARQDAKVVMDADPGEAQRPQRHSPSAGAISTRDGEIMARGYSNL